jgi:hypothetical protein
VVSGLLLLLLYQKERSFQKAKMASPSSNKQTTKLNLPTAYRRLASPLLLEINLLRFYVARTSFSCTVSGRLLLVGNYS